MKKEHNMTPNEFMHKGLNILEHNKLLRTERKCLAKYFLCHQENRNRLMLNSLQVHKKAAVIASIGADRKQLATAVCVEIAPHGPTRVSNIEANKLLVSRSAGLLAPVNGEELYLSLGCGHIVAFCKAAPLAGPTPEETIADDNGNIDVGLLNKQSEFRLMLEEGWEWQVLPWEVDTLFPRFSKITQKALNGSNSAATEIGELDTMTQIADLLHSLADRPQAEADAMTLKSIRSSCMSCASYAKPLLDFVRLYGGGEGTPLIVFLDGVGKSFNSTMVLGSAFWNALTYTKYNDETSRFPLIRIGMALVNLSSTNKSDDGSAKFLSKGDVSQTSQKWKLPQAREAEKMLEQCMEIQGLMEIEAVDRAKMQKPLGKVFVRVALWLTNKQIAGPDGKEYKMEEIKALYLADLSEVVSKTVCFEPWGSTTPFPAPAPGSGDQARDGAPRHTLPTSRDLQSATWLGAAKGFKVGATIAEKSIENSSRWYTYTITGISDEKSEFSVTKVTLYNTDEAELIGKVTLVDILQNWKLQDAVQPICTTLSEKASPAIDIDLKRASIHAAIVNYDGGAASLELVFWRKPDQVRTGKDTMPKGRLHLVPVLNLVGITTKPMGLSLGPQKVNGVQVPFFGLEPNKPKVEATPAEIDACTVAAFWWVGSTGIEEAANMEIVWVKSAGISFPIMTNKKAIQPFTQLLKYVATPKAAAKASTYLVPAPAAPPVASKPAKRQRKQ